MNIQTTDKAGVRPAITIAATDHMRLLALVARENGDAAEYLTEELNRARVVPDSDCSPQVARMGSQITYRDNATGGQRTVTLVYPAEADISRHRISILSPIGAALIGMSAGKSIVWPSPVDGERTLTVLEVKPADPPPG